VTAVKMAGFLVLLAAIFVLAHVVGGTVGSAATGHSQVHNTGSSGTISGPNTGGMDMGDMP